MWFGGGFGGGRRPLKLPLRDKFNPMSEANCLQKPNLSGRHIVTVNFQSNELFAASGARYFRGIKLVRLGAFYDIKQLLNMKLNFSFQFKSILLSHGSALYV